ncbi:MAG: hypothetical protein KJ015_40695, partial [Myxococcales bacterium]|nr:hypothetical protein [Myxococcales bacterium]
SAAQSSMQGRQATKLFMEGELPPAEVGELRLDELVKFFKSPPAYFLNRRLGLYLKQEDGGMSDREPLELDQLENWKLGTALLGCLLDDRPLDEAETLLRAQGELPLGHPGRLELEKLLADCEAIAERTRTDRQGSSLEPLEVRVELEDGTRVTGAIGDRWAGGVVRHTYSKLGSKYVLEAWIRHLALCSGSEKGARTVWIGRGKDADANAVEWAPLPAQEAARELAALVQLYRRGLERPLPFMPATSRDYFDAVGQGKNGEAAAVKAYDEGDLCETAFDPHPARAFSGMLPPFDPAFEVGEKELEDTEFHDLAAAVYGPLDAARAPNAGSVPKATAKATAKAAKAPAKATKPSKGGKKKS